MNRGRLFSISNRCDSAVHNRGVHWNKKVTGLGFYTYFRVWSARQEKKKEKRNVKHH